MNYSKVIRFLKNNGFKRVEKNSYANDKCKVEFVEEQYEVSDNEGCAMTSIGLNIYWLVGVLTYYGYIDKNYKQ